MRLGIIARSDNTGLGNQTRELVKLLEPFTVLLIDSTPFNNNKQHPEWYAKYNTITTNGFATDEEVDLFLENVDVVLSCEIFYNNNLIMKAKQKNIKTILQYNYELFENITDPSLPFPDVLLSPSQWNIENVQRLARKHCEVIYLPPPSEPSLFEQAKQNNFKKDHFKILHIAGKIAAMDRNGTNNVINMLKYSKTNYELVIKTQSDFETDCTDPRLIIDKNNIENREDMFDGFDAMLLPRKYAGLCLPMNEALLSGLPVFMTDTSPNNLILPKQWLLPGKIEGDFRTKAGLMPLFEVNSRRMAEMIDDYIESKNKLEQKEKAYEIGYENFVQGLKERYLDIING